MSDISRRYAGAKSPLRNYDYIVVGAGSAGCVIANKLSVKGANVLLLEAGRDTPPGFVPPDIEDLYPRSYYNEAYMWPGLKADQGGDGAGAMSHFPQGRVMGGGSSLMGMIALRGMPDDYDGWAKRGATGWSWSDVLPHFRRLESDRDFHGSLHGSEGRVSIRRHLTPDWPPFCRAVGNASARLGFSWIEDMNGEFGDGYGPLPMSSTLSSRVSSASAYLDIATRALPNLEIRCNCTVEALVFEGNRCVGVSALVDGAQQTYKARRTIVSAGAIHSPTLLLRSGIGSERDLLARGIPVVCSRPGVGGNLQNHPIVYLAAHMRPEARQSSSLRPGFNTALRFSSSSDPDSRGDLQMLVLNKSSWHGLGGSVAGLGVCLLRPLSRGSVTLSSIGPSAPPHVRFRMLTEQEDFERLAYGFGVACELMRDNEVRSLRNETFSAGYSRVVRRLNRPGMMSVITTELVKKVLDGPDAVRRNLLKWGIASGDIEEERLANETWRARTVRRRSFGTYHPVGTCAMGHETDPLAVVDSAGSVLGVEGLSVVDASIMPSIPRANTNLPVLMIAERASDLILKLDD